MIRSMKRLFGGILVAVLATGSLLAARLDVTDGENGKDLILRRGDLLTVTLNANRTTGYGWHPSFSREGILTSKGAAVYQHGHTGMVGAGGTEIWTFRAVREGKTTLTLGYVRPWEKGIVPVKTVAWPVTVRP